MMYRVDHIDPDETAFIVAQMENDFVAPGAPFQTPAGRRMLPELKQALAVCRENGVPVIYTTHAHDPRTCDKGHPGQQKLLEPVHRQRYPTSEYSP